MPDIEILQSTLSMVPGKGKHVIDDGIRPLDGQCRQPISSSLVHDSTSQDTTAKTSRPSSSPEGPRVMTDHELLISLHEKLDKHHLWVKRQFAAV